MTEAPILVSINGSMFSNHRYFSLIAGPCQIESLAHAKETAACLREICQRLKIDLVYKSSFDKANRTSGRTKRGIGMSKGCVILAKVRQDIGVPVITDVHESRQCDYVAAHVDALQIPAFLCRQTDLIEAAAKTGKPLNIKKGQFISPQDMAHVVRKAMDTGNGQVMVCERGACFGYGNLISDMRSLVIMRQVTAGCPVIFDATHSVQLPAGAGDRSGGQREFVPVLARAAVAVGIAGLFIECHEDPDKAPSDGPNMITFKDLEALLRKLQYLDRVTKEL